MAKTLKKITSLAVALACLICAVPTATLSASADGGSSALCVTADEWTALFDRRNQSQTWLGADGIYSVAIDGNDAYGSATSETKTFFIFSDSLMGTSDAAGNVTWAPGQPSQTSAVLTGNVADSDNIEFVWGTGGNGSFGWQQHLFGEHKWMLDCFVVGDAIYILGFPEQNWKPKQMDMIKIPIVNGEPDYANYSKTSNIVQLNHYDDSNTYLYSYGVGVMNNTVSAGAPDPDGYIYFYGYRDAMQEFSRKDLIVSRLKESDFPDFSNLTYWNGESWVTDIEESAALVRNVSCEFSVTPITSGPSAGKYIAVYTEGTESANINYAIGDSPVGPFEKPVTFYVTPEHGQDNGGMYTYNAKAHPHLSCDGRLLVSYNCNNRNTFGQQKTYEYHPRFLWLDLDEVYPAEENLALSPNGGEVTASTTTTANNDHPVDLVADADTSSYWESDNDTGAEQYLTVNWSEAKNIQKLVLMWGGGRPSYDTANNDPTGYGNVEYYDGSAWVAINDVSFSREGEGIPYTDTITLTNSIQTTGIRVHFKGYDKNGPYQCYEFEAYAPSSADDDDDDAADVNVSHAVAQLSNAANSQDEHDVRIIAAVDSLNYSNIGFVVTATDNENIGAQTEFFTDNNVFNSINDVTSAPFGIENGYVFSLTVREVPDGARFVVRPFADKKDGTRVYGDMRIISVSDGEITVE